MFWDLDLLFITFLLFVVSFISGLGMGLKGLLGTSDFARVVLVLWLLSSFFVLFLLSRIDYVVHHDLYDFGLQFSFVWATPYWAVLRSVYICLAIPSILSAVILSLDLWRIVNDRKRVSRRGDESERGAVKRVRENSMVISCPSCKKVFGKPLVMLDFSDGKPRLVNVCPYCNAVLGSADEEKFTDRTYGFR